MRALCVSLKAVLFLSIHVVHRRERPGHAGGLLLLIRQDNKLCRIHLAHNDAAFNAEWCFSQARMSQTGSGHPLKTVEISSVRHRTLA